MRWPLQARIPGAARGRRWTLPSDRCRSAARRRVTHATPGYAPAAPCSGALAVGAVRRRDRRARSGPAAPDQEDECPRSTSPSTGTPASLAGGDQGLVVGILVISLVALGFAGLFAKEVLAAGQGTPKMIEIAKAVQEGAAAYLRRQFTTLAAFAVLVFLLLFLLPAETGGVRVGRSLAFLPAPSSRRSSGSSA